MLFKGSFNEADAATQVWIVVHDGEFYCCAHNDLLLKVMKCSDLALERRDFAQYDRRDVAIVGKGFQRPDDGMYRSCFSVDSFDNCLYIFSQRFTQDQFPRFSLYSVNPITGQTTIVNSDANFISDVLFWKEKNFLVADDLTVYELQPDGVSFKSYASLQDALGPEHPLPADAVTCAVTARCAMHDSQRAICKDSSGCLLYLHVTHAGWSGPTTGKLQLYGPKLRLVRDLGTLLLSDRYEPEMSFRMWMDAKRGLLYICRWGDNGSDVNVYSAVKSKANEIQGKQWNLRLNGPIKYAVQKCILL